MQKIQKMDYQTGLKNQLEKLEELEKSKNFKEIPEEIESIIKKTCLETYSAKKRLKTLTNIEDVANYVFVNLLAASLGARYPDLAYMIEAATSSEDSRK